MSSSSNCSDIAHKNTKDVKIGSKNISNGRSKSYYGNSDGVKTQTLETNLCLKNTTSKISNSYDTDQIALRNHSINSKSPKIEDKIFNKIKHEKTSHNDFSPNSMSTKSPTKLSDRKPVKMEHMEEAKYNDMEVKREEDQIKIENGNIETKKHLEIELFQSRTKRSCSENGSPYKEKKRKKPNEDNVNQPMPTINQIDLSDPRIQKPFISKVYYSYFERTTDDKDEIKEMK